MTQDQAKALKKRMDTLMVAFRAEVQALKAEQHYSNPSLTLRPKKTRLFWLSIKRLDKCLFSRRNGYQGLRVMDWSVCLRLFGKDMLTERKR